MKVLKEKLNKGMPCPEWEVEKRNIVYIPVLHE
jgi:hypothetical protein